MPDPKQEALSRFSIAIDGLRRSIPDAGDPTVKFIPKRITLFRSDEGDTQYKAVALAQMSVKPTAEAQMPARIAKLGPKGLDALFSFAEGGEAFLNYNDPQVWEQALAAAAELGLDGHASRKLSEFVNLGLLARRGCPKVKIEVLP
jgi:hypothetical protein